MARASLVSFVFGCLLALAASMLPSIARACDGDSCAKTALLPPDDGSVPANSVEVIWRRSASSASEDAGTELRLYELDGGTRRELSFTRTSVPGDDSGLLQRIVPGEQLAAGTALEVEAEEACGPEQARVTNAFRVGPAVPVPSSLGRLELLGYQPNSVESLELRVQSGECYLPYSVISVRVSVVLAASARPYADLLRYELHVDGQPYTSDEAPPKWREEPPLPIGGSTLGRGVDRIYRICAPPSPFRVTTASAGLSPGRHRLQMFALLPDGTRLATDEVEVSMYCPLEVPRAVLIHDGDDSPAPSAFGATELVTSSSAGQAAGRAPDTAPDAAMVLDGGTIEPSAHRAGAQCSPLIGTRTGRPLLWVLFLLLISIVAGRTKRRQHALGSPRQNGPDAGARRPPRL